jgi:hypothetical protein
MPAVTKQATKAAARKPDPDADVLSRIVPLSVEGGIKMNIYGMSGSGKTRLAATFPAPLLWILASGGKKPGELRSVNTPENRKRIHQVVLNDGDELSKIYEFQANEQRFATVIIDHLSGLQDLVLRKVLDIPEIPPQGSWGMASQQQWGETALKMKELCRPYLGLDCNVVLLAQERAFNTEREEGMEVLMPYVASGCGPSFVGWLNPAVDYIVNTFKRQKTVTKKVKVAGKEVTRKEVVPGQIEYCLRIGPDAVYTTKFREPPTGRPLPDVIVNPDYAKIKKLIDGE